MRLRQNSAGLPRKTVFNCPAVARGERKHTGNVIASVKRVHLMIGVRVTLCPAVLAGVSRLP
jgi:hypothetical protein